MLKKILNAIICLGLIMQNFAFIFQVEAEEINTPNIKTSDIYQGNKKAKLDDNNNFVIDNYDDVYLDLKLENIEESKDYYIKLENKQNSIGFMYDDSYQDKTKLNFHYLNDSNGILTYNIKVCDNWECNKVYASKAINVKIDYFDKIKNSKVIISDINQGDNNFETKDEYGYKNIYLNNKQTISLKLTGENLIDDASYVVNGDGLQSNLIYSGSELKKGVEVKYYPTLRSSSFNINVELQDIQIQPKIKYNDGTKTYDYFQIILNEDENLQSYSYNLFYTNYMNKIIKKSDLEYKEYYIINSNYHNDKNTLSLNINGNKYLDKDYQITISVKQANNTIYNKKLNVNGLLLNNGYQIELDGLALELNKDENGELYEFYVDVDNAVTKQEYKYNSVGKDAYISSNIFFENGKKNLSVFRGDGNYFFNSGIYDTNKDVFTKYNSIFLRYMGSNLNNDETYEYILEYGNFNESNNSRNYEVTLKTGKVTGFLLNTIGLLFKVDNNKNYINPVYKLTLKKGDEILYVDAPVIYIVNSPTLANVSLKANKKNLYLKTSDLSYIATRNSQIEFSVSGLGFEENTYYEFDYCTSLNYNNENPNGNNKCEKVKFKGKDLNSGTAVLKYDKKIDKNVKSIDVYLYCELKKFSSENSTIQGGFNVTFVDSKDFFQNLTKYFVDNVNDLIKNISKNTNVEDFTKNVDIKDNGKVKIFDTNGTTEINGKIGTGMIARVVNEYDENVLDLDVVVKGDVTGDGNISVTDLAKIKRHLAGNEKLTGVYETAGNITDSGSVSITDLVKISRDVAKIQEVK